MPPGPSRQRLICLALALVTLLAYLPAARQGFILYDDPEYISQNRVVQAGLTLTGVRWAFTTFQCSLWIPLTWLSHMLDCEWFGVDPAAHHIVGALFHAANAGLFFWVLVRLGGALWPSAFAAALFAWHPLRVESVAWAAERKDLLSGFFFLLTLWAYSRFARGEPPLPSESQSSRSRSKARGPKLVVPACEPILRLSPPFSIFYFLSLASFACGLMCKPMLVTLPFVLLLLDFWPLGRLAPPAFRIQPEHDNTGGRGPSAIKITPRPRLDLRRLLWEKVPFFGLSAGACVVTALAARSDAVATEHYGLVERLVNALAAYGSYLVNLVIPLKLAIVYPLPARPAWGQAAASAVALTLITWMVWRARSSRPWWLTGWLWFLGTLVPVIGLVQVGTQAWADRFTYIPFMGLALAVGWDGALWVRRLRLRPAITGAVCGLVLTACLGATERQLGFWSSDEHLFQRALDVTPDNPIAHANMGVALEQQGRTQEARLHYEAALSRMPNLAQVRNNLANLLDRAGDTNAALAQYLEARRLQPDAPLIHANYGSMLMKLGRLEEAVAEFSEAARLSPADPRPPYLLGKALLRQGRSTEALKNLEHALEIDPNDVPALAFLARLLATDANASLRNGPRAVALAERANTLTGGEQPAILDVLAMTYAATARFAEAQAAARKAVDQTLAAGDTNALPELRQRLKLFESSQPFQQSR